MLKNTFSLTLVVLACFLANVSRLKIEFQILSKSNDGAANVGRIRAQSGALATSSVFRDLDYKTIFAVRHVSINYAQILKHNMWRLIGH